MLWVDYVTPKMNEITRQVSHWENGGRPDGNPVRIAMIQNITMDIAALYLKYYCYKDNLIPSIFTGDYDQVMPLVMQEDSSLFQFQPEVIVAAIKLELLSDRLCSQFLSLSPSEIEAEEQFVLDYFNTLLEQIRRHSDAVVLFHNFERPAFPALGVLETQSSGGQLASLQRLNQGLAELAGQHQSTYVVDVDRLQIALGRGNLIDDRYWHMARAPYCREGAKALAWEYMKFVRNLKGKGRKCLVLDCDNTLWGGIVGEDGLEGIRLGHTYPGSAFRDFQKAILNLHHRGVLLTLCSKNNEKDALEVLEKHPDMILRPEHIVAHRINWQDKASNIAEIAGELNLGLDSFVFLDDNEFEINLVSQQLPMVTSVKLPDDPSRYRLLLESCGLFDSLAYSEEDRKRSHLYKAQVQRKAAQTKFDGARLDDYYRYLEMKVVLKKADTFSIPRVAQLTQRTNQFNLTTRRYSEEEINEMASSEDKDVVCLQLEDRFGESGIVGVAILNYQNGDCVVNNLLLSCRVIGRGVEDVLLKEVEHLARNSGCQRLIGHYRPTPKNAQVSDFYPKRGFEQVNRSENSGSYQFELSGTLNVPDYFSVIEGI